MKENKIISITLALVGVIFAGLFLFKKSQPKIVPATQSETTQTLAQKTVNFTSLSSVQLAMALSQKDFFFVNVHTPYEGEIKKTDAFIPYDKIADNLDKLPKDKKAKIVLYCQSGRMSEIAARELIQLGYTQVTHLSGGMVDWKKNGYGVYPVE
jgi:rhodanese-related sulfurtransferase